MAQPILTIAEWQRRLQAAVEIKRQGGTSAEALLAAFGPVDADTFTELERDLHTSEAAAWRAIPRPDRKRRWRG